MATSTNTHDERVREGLATWSTAALRALANELGLGAPLGATNEELVDLIHPMRAAERQPQVRGGV